MTGPEGPDAYYAPNQQVVRGDGSGPAEEGTGGTEPVEPEVEPQVVEAEPEAEPEAKARGGAS